LICNFCTETQDKRIETHFFFASFFFFFFKKTQSEHFKKKKKPKQYVATDVFRFDVFKDRQTDKIKSERLEEKKDKTWINATCFGLNRAACSGRRRCRNIPVPAAARPIGGSTVPFA
jgi:hypothetical protein